MAAEVCDLGCQCPFADREDRRCASVFSLEKLDFAFNHCFGDYKACSVYQELLAERTTRRSLAGRVAGWIGSKEEAVLRLRNNAASSASNPVPVSLTISASSSLRPAGAGADRHAQSAAAA